MKTERTWTVWVAATMVAAVAYAEEPAAKASEGKAADAPKAQTKCPIMGGAVNKDTYVDAGGSRIYMCCKGCEAKIKADPAAAIAKIRAAGEEPEKLKTEASADAGCNGKGTCPVGKAGCQPAVESKQGAWPQADAAGCAKDAAGCAKDAAGCAKDADKAACPMSGKKEAGAEAKDAGKASDKPAGGCPFMKEKKEPQKAD